MLISYIISVYNTKSKQSLRGQKMYKISIGWNHAERAKMSRCSGWWRSIRACEYVAAEFLPQHEQRTVL